MSGGRSAVDDSTAIPALILSGKKKFKPFHIIFLLHLPVEGDIWFCFQLSYYHVTRYFVT